MKRLQTDALWTEIDDYLDDCFVPGDDALDAALASSEAAGLPRINVAPNQGKLLMLLAQAIGASRILEIGTLGGYSTIWLARGLAPGSKLITLDANAKFAEVARVNIARAGFAEMVELRVGKANDTLPSLAAEPPFDLIFIDADKPNNPNYLSWAMKLSRPGTVIVCDNVIRDGDVIKKDSRDESVQGARAAFSFIGKDTRLESTAIQTVGAKGYDGFAIAIVS